MSRLSLSLLGPFSATLDGEPITGFEANKVRALLAYLVVEAHRYPDGHPRHTLAGLLWPDKPERAALSNLRNALSNLRTAIGDRRANGVRGGLAGGAVRGPFLLITRETIRFDPASDHWLDVAAFQGLVDTTTLAAAAHPAHQRLQQAVALYCGDFLQGFSVRDSPEFEEWALLLREKLHYQALEAWGALAAYHEGRGAYREAIACTRRQVALEPWHEGAHRRRMRALALSGQRSLALAQYAACCRVLADELGVEPETATTALYQQIRQGTLAVSRRAPLAASQRVLAGVQTQEPQARAGPLPGQAAAGALPVELALDGERRMVTSVRAEILYPEGAHVPVDACGGAGVAGRVRHALVSEAARFGGKVHALVAPQRGMPSPQHALADGLVVCFGAEAAHEDDPERALLAALAMQAEFGTRVAEWAQERELDRPLSELRLLVTVHTGQVEVAAIREADAECAMMQEALTFAAQMQTLADPGPGRGQVWVSEATRRLVEPLFEWAPQGKPFGAQDEARAGSSEQAMQAYCPLGRKASLTKMRGVAGLSSPLIGRDAEFQALRQAVARLQNGVGGIVTVVGEAGLGKSRLVAELRRHVLSAVDWRSRPQSANLGWTEGRCLSYTTHVAYQVCRDALSGLLGLDPDASAAAAADRLRERVRALCRDQADEIYPFLAQMMSLPLSSSAESRLRGIEGEGLQRLTFRAVERVLESAAEQAPLVVVCEDLHWADVTSIELLLRLFALADRVPILWICVFRPETDRDCWRLKEACVRHYAHRYTDLWLRALSDGESALLVGHLLEIEHLPESLRARILARAEGNPFYVEEILRSLIDDGVIAYDPLDGRWRAGRAVRVEALPDTLRGMLVSRVDRLPRETRQVLQLASVVGRIFSLRVLETLCSPHPRRGAERPSRLRGEAPRVGRLLGAHLVALQRAEMVREQSRLPEATYVFKHQLTLEAAYDSVPPRKRRVLHRRVAKAIEQLFPERGSPPQGERELGLLAYHWERAGDARRAVSLLRRAGESAAAQFANADAISYLSRALELVPNEDTAARYALLLAREGVYDVQGARKAQQEDLDALEEAAESGAQRAEVAWRRARYAEMISDHRAAIDAAQEAVRLAQIARDVESEVHARLVWSRALTYLDQHQEAWQQCKQAQILAQAEQMRPLEATSLHWLGRISMFTRNAEGSKDYLNRAWEILIDIGDRRGQGSVLLSLCSAYRRLEDYAPCRSCGERALDLFRETGEQREMGWVFVELGKACFTLGDYTEAKVYWEQALPIFEATGARRGEAWVREQFGWIARATGDDAAARDYLEQALPLFRQAREPRSEGRVLVMLAQYCQSLGENRAGLAYARQALSLGRRIGDHHIQGTALTAQGYILSGMEQFAQAAAAFQQALGLRHKFIRPITAVMPLAGLAEVCLAQGDRAQALSHVEAILDCAGTPSRLRHVWEPFPVYLILYRVLHANGDRRAVEVLETAHRLLLAQAAKIGGEDLRRAYLENVAANREIIAAWEETSHP